jgi:hypothetical protein
MIETSMAGEENDLEVSTVNHKTMGHEMPRVPSLLIDDVDSSMFDTTDKNLHLMTW